MTDAKSTDNDLELALLREFAHEIRTPLNAMLGFSAMMKPGALPQPLSEERIFDYADRINVSTRRLLQVCERVLDQAVQGQVIVQKEDIDFHTFCPEIIRTFEVDAESRGITLNYTIADDFPILHSDPVVLYEIMSNLLSNAIKFTPQGGNIDFSAHQEDDGALTIIVSDSGYGIPPDKQQTILEPFEQVSDIYTRNHEGSGMGLFLVNSLVTLHGGSLSIDSEVDTGTTITIRLPAERTIAA